MLNPLKNKDVSSIYPVWQHLKKQQMISIENNIQLSVLRLILSAPELKLIEIFIDDKYSPNDICKKIKISQ